MKRVASLGIHIVDILGRPVQGIPPGQDLAILDEIRITVAGTAAGTSVDLAKLGMEVVAFGAIGEDGLGDFLLETMQKYSINTSGLVRKEGVQTSSTMLPIRPNGERPALHVPGANARYSLDDVDFDLLGTCDFLHVGGTPLMPEIDGEGLREVFQFARKKGIVTTYDLLAMPHPNLQSAVDMCMPWVDYFMPGLDEARMICGAGSAEETIQYYLDQGVEHLVFKNGAEGSLYTNRQRGAANVLHVPVISVPVVDSTGCGDSYCAGFITGLAHQWDVEKSMQLGSTCGALVIQGLGSDAGIVDFSATVALMEQSFR